MEDTKNKLQKASSTQEKNNNNTDTVGCIDISMYQREYCMRQRKFELGDKKFYYEVDGKNGKCFKEFGLANQMFIHFTLKKTILTRKNRQHDLQLNLAKIETEIHGNYILAYRVEKGIRQKIVFGKM